MKFFINFLALFMCLLSISANAIPVPPPEPLLYGTPSPGLSGFSMIESADYPIPNLGGKVRFQFESSLIVNGDPIVFPGQPGMGHSHTFMGNTCIDFSLTGQALLNLMASCNTTTAPGGAGWMNAYWYPTAGYMNGGKFYGVYPSSILMYYTYGNDTVSPRNEIIPIPDGLRFIVGDSKRRTITTASDSARINYGCNGSPTYSAPTLDAMPCKSFKMTIPGPNCWNGVDLDSPDHKSHVAYSGVANRNGMGPNGCLPGWKRMFKTEMLVGMNMPYNDSQHPYYLSSDDTDYPAGTSLHYDVLSVKGPHSAEIDKYIKDNCIVPGNACGVNVLGEIDPLKPGVIFKLKAVP